MNRVNSILRKMIGQVISIALGYVAYLLTKDVLVALTVTGVTSRIMEPVGL